MDVVDLVKKLRTRRSAVILFILVLGGALYYYSQWRAVRAQLQDLAAQSQQTSVEDRVAQQQAIEVRQVVERVGEIVLLPRDEEPTVATLVNKSEIRENQDFFRDAENGDKILVYKRAHKAFLYRPSAHLLINAAPLGGSDQSEQAGVVTGEGATITPRPPDRPATIVIRNGTTRGGAAALFEAQLVSAFDDRVAVLGLEKAVSTHPESQIILLQSDFAGVAAAIADKLDLTVSRLPAEETKPAADILIIIGADAPN